MLEINLHCYMGEFTSHVNRLIRLYGDQKLQEFLIITIPFFAPTKNSENGNYCDVLKKNTESTQKFNYCVSGFFEDPVSRNN